MESVHRRPLPRRQRSCAAARERGPRQGGPSSGCRRPCAPRCSSCRTPGCGSTARRWRSRSTGPPTRTKLERSAHCGRRDLRRVRRRGRPVCSVMTRTRPRRQPPPSAEAEKGKASASKSADARAARSPSASIRRRALGLHGGSQLHRLTPPIEDELRGRRREDEPHDAARHVDPRPAEDPHHAPGEQEREERDAGHQQHRGEERDLLARPVCARRPR